MAKLTDFQKVRKQRAHKKTLKRVGLFSTFVMLIFFATYALDYAEQHDIGLWINSYMSSFSSGDGFPVGISGAEIIEMDSAQGNIALVGNGQVFIYNKQGALVSGIKHSYFNVGAKCTRNKTLLYDRGGKKLAVYSGDKKSFEKEYNQNIYCAEINSSGTLAVATRAEKYRGEMIVYNSKFTEILRWSTSDGNILQIALPPKGTEIAVATVETSGGGIVSTINIMDSVYDEKQAKLQLADELVLSLEYSQHDQNLHVLTDKNAYEIARNGAVVSTYSYEGKTLWAYDFCEGTTLLALGDYVENRELEIIRLDQGLIPSATAVIDERLLDMCVEDKTAYVLTDNTVHKWDENMQPSGSFSAPDAELICTVDGNLYYVTEDTLNMFVPPTEDKK